MATTEFCKVTGLLTDPDKTQVTPVAIDETAIESVTGIRADELGKTRTMMLLKIFDDKGNRKLPESVRADDKTPSVAHKGTDSEPILVLSHAIMPDHVKGTMLATTFNYDQQVTYTTVGELKKAGLEAGCMLTRSSRMQQAEKPKAAKPALKLVAA